MALERTLEELPPVMRQSNTTFVNLRAALDDVEPLINTAKPATKNLAPFLAELRPVLNKFIPFTQNLDAGAEPARPATTTRPRCCRNSRPSRSAPRRAFPHAEAAIAAFQPQLNFARSYTPDLFNALGHLGAAAGAYDGNGNYVRASISGANLFKYDGGKLTPITRGEQFNGFTSTSTPRRCPGGATQPAADGSNPYVEPAARRQLRQPVRMQREPGDGGRMKKLIAGLVVVAAVVVAIVLISGGGSSEGYVVRAVFDNGSFMVAGEQVRVAGANVGTIKAVSVSLPGEPTAEENGKFVDVPGKAIIELEIEDPSFQDFRQDAGLRNPPAVADRREVRELPPDRAAGAGRAAAAAAEADPERRTGRGPVPAAARRATRPRSTRT